jgi:hypothetical protein
MATQKALGLRTWYPFNRTNIELVPDTSGVYWLGVDNNIIYIGSSRSLPDLLLEHYYTNDPSFGRARQCAIEPCINYVERERELLRAYLKTHGRLPECNELIP